MADKAIEPGKKSTERGHVEWQVKEQKKV